MKHLKRYKSFNRVDEGWKENILVAIALSSSVAYSQPKFDTSFQVTPKTELVEPETVDDKRQFYSACFQLCEELKNPELTFDQRRGLVEAQLYFQSKRDGQKPQKLSEYGKAGVKSVMNTIMDLDADEVARLSELGQTGKLTAEILGK